MGQEKNTIVIVTFVYLFVCLFVCLFFCLLETRGSPAFLKTNIVTINFICVIYQVMYDNTL